MARKSNPNRLWEIYVPKYRLVVFCGGELKCRRQAEAGMIVLGKWMTKSDLVVQPA